MDKTVYIKTREIKIFNVKVADITDKYEQCDRYDFEPITPIMQTETKLNEE